MARSDRHEKDIELEMLFATGEPLKSDDGDLVSLPSMMLMEEPVPVMSTAEAVEKGIVVQRVTGELPYIALDMDALKIGDEVELEDGTKSLIQWMSRGKQRLGLGKRKGKNYLFVSLSDIKTVNGYKIAEVMDRKRAEAARQEGQEVRPAPMKLPKFMPQGLMEHQIEAVGFVEARDGRCVLALEMGLGKTVVSAVCIQAPAVAVVPAQVNVNWVREINRWRPDLSVALIKGGKPELVTAEMRRADVVVLNYEIVGKHLEWLRDRKHKTVIADEAQYIKNLKVRWDKRLRAFFPTSTTQRANDFYLLQKDVPRMMLLTGTPVMNRTSELWPMLHLVNPNEWGSFVRFCYRYCGGEEKWVGRRSVLKCDGRTNSDELFARTNGITVLRMKKGEVLNLPEKRRCTKVVSLDPNVAKEYAKASREFLSWVEERGGWEAAAKASRAASLAKLTALRELSAVGKAPAILNEIVEFFESTQRPLVVMARSRAAMQLMADGLEAENESFRKLGSKSRLSREIQHDMFVGGLGASRRQEIVDRFQRGEIDVLFYSIEIATGVTLTRSQDMFFVERNWRPADQLQAEDRCHRIGQKNEVMITYYDGEGTMDAAMALLLADKVTTAGAVIDGVDLSEEEALQIVLGEMVRPELPAALRRNKDVRKERLLSIEEVAAMVDMRRVDDDGDVIDRDGDDVYEGESSWADDVVTESWHDPL
jgi:SNF2 family DNA or RNA helicase